MRKTSSKKPQRMKKALLIGAIGLTAGGATVLGLKAHRAIVEKRVAFRHAINASDQAVIKLFPTIAQKDVLNINSLATVTHLPRDRVISTLMQARLDELPALHNKRNYLQKKISSAKMLSEAAFLKQELARIDRIIGVLDAADALKMQDTIKKMRSTKSAARQMKALDEAAKRENKQKNK